MAERDGDTAYWQKVQKEELPHCGLCDPVTRHVERGDGRVELCSRCHPLQDALLPQTWRCPACHALIYRTERGLPCDKHRTIIGWRAAYDAARSGAEPLLPNPVTEAGATTARGLLAGRPRAADPDGGPAAGLWGEALARQQAAEARAARIPDPPPDDGDGEEAPPDDDEYRPPF